MNEVLRPELFEGCIVYLDDVIVYGQSFDATLSKLDKVLTLLSKANLKINPQKCKLFEEEVHFLGHCISSEGVGTKAIVEWPIPNSTSSLHSFVGLANYYRSVH